MKMKFIKFTEINRDTCMANGCNNTPDDDNGMYCLMHKAMMGMVSFKYIIN